MLAMVHFTPLFGAVLVCWIFSVCVHEFAHAVVAYCGGDRSVREKGYLSFNPFAYVHPVTSILIPAAFLAMGGLPLPGGAVSINTAALRSRHWSALVSAAGPVSNFLLFLVIAWVLHPSTGLVDPGVWEQPNWARVLGAMAVLEILSVFLNLIPVPPLDGFGIIEPYLGREARQAAARLGWGGLLLLFMAFRYVDGLQEGLHRLVDMTMDALGLPFEITWRQFNVVFFGESE